MTFESSEIEQLVLRAQQGDDDAVTQLYEAHAPAIYRYIVYRVPDDEAEDLTAEVFVKMVEGLPDYQVTGVPFEAWLYRIAAARIADYYRQRKRQPQAALSETLSTDDPQPEEHLLEQQEIGRLRSAISQLNEEQQTILVLRFIERKSHEEVAAIVGKSVTAVKSIQHRALTRLSTLLGSDGKARHYLRGEHE